MHSEPGGPDNPWTRPPAPGGQPPLLPSGQSPPGATPLSSDREQQLTQLAYQAGRAQAMAEAAMFAAHTARMQPPQHPGPGQMMQTNVHFHAAPRRRGMLNGCAPVLLILFLIAGAGVGVLILPVNELVGVGIIISFGVGLLVTICCMIWE